MKITPVNGTIYKDGTAFGPGDELDLPNAEAQRIIDRGQAQEVKPPKPAKPEKEAKQPDDPKKADKP